MHNPQSVLFAGYSIIFMNKELFANKSGKEFWFWKKIKRRVEEREYKCSVL